MIVFRPMQLDDIEAVFHIEKQAYDFPWSKTLFEQAIKSSKYCVVAECQNQTIGYGILSYVVGEAELLNICIDINQQGRGYAKLLLNHLVEHAAQKDNQEKNQRLMPDRTGHRRPAQNRWHRARRATDHDVLRGHRLQNDGIDNGVTNKRREGQPHR